MNEEEDLVILCWKGDDGVMVSIQIAHEYQRNYISLSNLLQRNNWNPSGAIRPVASVFRDCKLVLHWNSRHLSGYWHDSVLFASFGDRTWFPKEKTDNYSDFRNLIPNAIVYYRHNGVWLQEPKPSQLEH